MRKSTINFFYSLITLFFSNYSTLLVCTTTLAGVGVFLILVLYLILFLSETLKALHCLDDHLVLLSQGLQESKTELLKLQEQILDLKTQKELKVLEITSFFSWNSAATLSGVGLVVVILLSSAVVYKDHQTLNDLWLSFKI